MTQYDCLYQPMMEAPMHRTDRALVAITVVSVLILAALLIAGADWRAALALIPVTWPGNI